MEYLLQSGSIDHATRIHGIEDRLRIEKSMRELHRQRFLQMLRCHGLEYESLADSDGEGSQPCSEELDYQRTAEALLRWIGMEHLIAEGAYGIRSWTRS